MDEYPVWEGWELKRPEKRTDSPLTQWLLRAGGCHTLHTGEQLEVGSR